MPILGVSDGAWLAEQVSDYFLRTYKDYMEYEDHMKALLEVQPFRDV